MFLVAEDKDKNVIGWIHVFIAVRIESETFAEIGGLVVNENIRGYGCWIFISKQSRRMGNFKRNKFNES